MYKWLYLGNGARLNLGYYQLLIKVAYALSDDVKIIDFGWPSRSVTTSTVGSIWVCFVLIANTFSMYVRVLICALCSKSETRSNRRKKSSADLGFHYPGDLLSQARRRRPLHKRNTVSDFADNAKYRQATSAMLLTSVEPGKYLIAVSKQVI